MIGLDIFGNETNSIVIDGIECKPLHRFNVEIPGYFVSKCGKIWSSKSNKWKKTFVNWRNKRGEGKPKCLDFSVTTPSKPFRELGMEYSSKGGRETAEFRLKLHFAVKTVWHPLKDYSHELNISKEQWDAADSCWKALAYSCICIDHIDDDIFNNNLDNLQYSNPLLNSNYRKKWDNVLI